jgi:protein SCO1
LVRPLAGKVRIALAGLALLLVVGAVAACGSGSDSSATGATTTASFDGLPQKPQKPVPPLQLDNSLGQPVNIDNYRGKAVLVTFIYDHCPDVCPIIVGNLHTAQQELGSEANKLQIIAVSVDPRGDTPKTVAAFLKEHQMTGRMQYLIGSRPQLENVWSDWGIAAKNSPEKGNPDAVEHSALVYGISGSGKMTTVYPANFKPKEIVHDVPLLASS